jgi:hypothetical protein
LATSWRTAFFWYLALRMTGNLHWRLRDGDAPRRFNFSEEDKLALEAFLHVLTDTSVLQDPKFSDPFD